MSIALAARRFLRAQSQAVLSTLSARHDGAPFGSLAPFVLDQQGAPWMLLSGLAEHSRNLQAKAQLSLFVQAAQSHVVDVGRQLPQAADAPLASRGDSQASARLTLVGKAELLSPDAALRARFIRYQPQAESYLKLGDFRFWGVQPLELRFIEGFARAHWVSASDFLVDGDAFAQAEQQTIDWLHSAHASNLQRLAVQAGAASRRPQVQLLGLDGDGLDMLVDGQRRRLAFFESIAHPSDWPDAFAALLQPASPAQTR